MLTVICGEDYVASRKYFHEVRKKCIEQGYNIKFMNPNDLGDMTKWLAESPTLFSQKTVYFSEHLLKYSKSKKNKKQHEEAENLAIDESVEWYDWEKGSLRDLATFKKGVFKEFKPNETIFTLLDNFYPDNLTVALRQLNILIDNQDAGFVFAMLAKHIRNLLIVKTGQQPPGMAPWQRQKLYSQVQFWSLDKLLVFYEGLARIDVSVKTSSNSHGIKNSLDILGCLVL